MSDMHEPEPTTVDTPPVAGPTDSALPQPPAGGPSDKGRWAKQFDKAKNSAAHPFKSGAERVGTGINNKLDLEKQKLQHGWDASAIGKMSKEKGFKNRMGALGKHAKDKFANSDLGKKLKDMMKKAQKVMQFIAQNWQPIAIITAIVGLGIPTALFIAGIAQSAGNSPHYYCDTEASASLKKSAVYQQYCTNGNGFDLSNLNGHYIIQDGSGPCVSCSMLNMMLRYFAANDVNLYDYMWGDDGQYTIDGQTLGQAGKINRTLRGIINSYSQARTDCFSKPGVKYGSRNFGLAHGVTINMANWGYLRDDSLDIDRWDAGSNYYDNNEDNSKWVWDLSVADKAIGSTWSLGSWYQNFSIGEVAIETVYSTDINALNTPGSLSTKLREIFDDNGTNYCPEAGVIVYYRHGWGSCTERSCPNYGSVDRQHNMQRHAILITGYEGTNNWTVIDPAKGVVGGYEGPFGTGNFAIWEDKVVNLINNGTANPATDDWAVICMCYCKSPAQARH